MPLPHSVGGAGSLSNTMSPGAMPTSLPSGILIHPAVWPHYTNVTDKTDRTGQTSQRSDSIGRTVLQMVAQKLRRFKIASISADIRVYFRQDYIESFKRKKTAIQTDYHLKLKYKQVARLLQSDRATSYVN